MNTTIKTAWLGGLGAVLSLLAAVPAAAQADDWETSFTRVGEEVFAAGANIDLGGSGGLTWAAGNTIDVTEPTGGVIAAGATIDIQKGADGPIIVAGSQLSIKGPVAGSIYATGGTLDLDVTHRKGTILAIGATILLQGETTGSVFLTGQDVRVEGKIAGDLYVTSETFSIADDAVVGGEIVYDVVDRQSLTLPEGLRGRPVTETEFREETLSQLGVNTGGGIAGDLGFFIFSLIIGILVVLLMRRQSDHFAAWMTTRPWQTVGTGFVGLSFWIGLTLTSFAIVLALAGGLSWFFLVLLALVPLVMLAGFLLMVLAYYHGVYAVGSLTLRFLPSGLSPVLRRLVVLSGALFVLFLVGLLSSGLAALLGSACLVLGFGVMGLRIWRGLPKVAATETAPATAG